MLVKVLGICGQGLRIRLISTTRLDARKCMQSVKSAWSILYSEPKPRVLRPPERNNKGHKHTHTKITASMILVKIL